MRRNPLEIELQNSGQMRNCPEIKLQSSHFITYREVVKVFKVRTVFFFLMWHEGMIMGMTEGWSMEL